MEFQEIKKLLFLYKQFYHLYFINKNKFWDIIVKELAKETYVRSKTEYIEKMLELKDSYKSYKSAYERTGAPRYPIPFYEVFLFYIAI